MSFLDQFIEYLSKCGVAPHNSSDIKPSGKWCYYRISGDRASDKKGVAIFNDYGNCAFGSFSDWRQGEWQKWNSFEASPIDDEARSRALLRHRAEEKRQQEQRKADQKAVADASQERWLAASPASPSHPYLKKKGVGPHELRQDGGVLLVPVFDENTEIVNIQTIDQRGEKLHQWKGRKAGCYSALWGGDDFVFITEGWATGASLFEAFGQSVIVAFDAGNLSAVAKLTRSYYPDARIIIAADHDQWTFQGKYRPKGFDKSLYPGDAGEWKEWREKGWLVNTGLVSAQLAARGIGAEVAIPPIPLDDPAKRTDWNDLHKSHNIDYIRSEISAQVALPLVSEGGDGSHSSSEMEMGLQPVAPTPSPPVMDIHWRDRLNYKRKGELNGQSLTNVSLFLQNDPDLCDLFCYDAFSKIKTLIRQPIWESGEFHIRPITDNDITSLAMFLESRGLMASTVNIARVLDTVIKSQSVNPAQDYFRALEWDGIPRLDTWLQDYCGATFDDPRLVSFFGRKWLLAAVTRVMRPGAKFDHMLILEGEQGVGKSRILAELATINDVRYFDDTIRASDLGNEKIVPKLQGVMIIEIQELSGFGKKDADELKQAITTEADRIVRKYENEPTIYPRQFVIAGTINPSGGYLHDATGNRRFWPVKVGKKIDVEGLRRVKEQIWAEAMTAFRAGEKVHIPDDDSGIYDLATAAQQERGSIHPWHDKIEIYVRNRGKVSSEDIWDHLNILDYTRRTRMSQRDIERIMTALGWEKKKIRDPERGSVQGWMKKGESE